MLSYPFSEFNDKATIAKQTCEELDRLYQYVFNKIKEGKQRSIENNKPLLVLFGERHHSLFSSLAELATISAGVQLGITRFCVELDNSRLDPQLALINSYLNDDSLIRKKHNDNELALAISDNPLNNTFLYYLLILHKLSLSPEPIDHGLGLLSTIDNLESLIKQGLPRRNAIMANELCEYKKDTFVIVGEFHLCGLVEDEKRLSDTFEIVEFGTYKKDFSYDEDLNAYTEHNKHLSNQLQRLFFKKDNKEVDINLFTMTGKNLDIHVRDYFINLCKPYLATLSELNIPQETQAPQAPTSLVQRLVTAAKDYIRGISGQEIIPQPSFKDSYDIDKFLKDVNYAQHKAVILTNKDKLSKLVKVSDDVIKVLKYFDPNTAEHNAIFEAIKAKLTYLIIDADDVTKVLEYLTDAQRAEVYVAVKDKLPGLIKEASDVPKVLRHLSVTQRAQVFNAIKDKLPSLIKELQKYNQVQLFLGSEQRNEVFAAFKEVILGLKTIYSLSRYMKVLTLKQHAEVLAAIKYKLPELIHDSRDLVTAFGMYEQENATELFELIKHKLTSLIENKYDLERVAPFLNNEQLNMAKAALAESRSLVLKRQVENNGEPAKRQKIDVERLPNAPAILEQPTEAQKPESSAKRLKIRR